MKTIAKNISLIVFALVATTAAHAQKVMNDPSYSTNNYKHPNKAAYMKKIQDAQPVVYVEEVKDESESKSENSLTASANYKNMSASKAKTKRFKQTDEPSIHVAPRVSAIANANYKSQFAGRARKTTNSQIQESPTPVATIN